MDKLTTPKPEAIEITIRRASTIDLPQLVELEQKSFESDRLSKRRIQHWLKADNCVFLSALQDQELLGYGLVLLHKGTRLARLYSIAVDKKARGLGIGVLLLQALEEKAAARGRLFMRLEVAKNNKAAISLYEKNGYRIFGEYSDYYEDHEDALRMQKRIRHISAAQLNHAIPWYRQTTEFTCGPSSLMMAMAALDKHLHLTQELELDLWREATTIFMTSGHGGSHPVGLAIAAKKRGFNAEVVINSEEPLFVDGVRAEDKKLVMATVDQHFRMQAKVLGIPVEISELTQNQIQQWIKRDFIVVVLISTYRLDGRKVPHWVTVTAMDDICFYVHDPDPDDKEQAPLDCQHIPIARADFAQMAAFGSGRLRTAVAISRRKKPVRKKPAKQFLTGNSNHE